MTAAGTRASVVTTAGAGTAALGLGESGVVKISSAKAACLRRRLRAISLSRSDVPDPPFRVAPLGIRADPPGARVPPADGVSVCDEDADADEL